MENFFDLIAPFYEVIHIRAKRTFRKIWEIGAFTEDDVVLDVGGGVGRIAKFFVHNVRSITVVDASEGMITQCRKQGGITCIQGQAESLPLGDASVNKVLIVDAFHHMPRRSEAIAEVYRVLKPGGMVIMEEFNPTRWGGRAIVVLEYILRLGSIFLPQKISQRFSHRTNSTCASSTRVGEHTILSPQNFRASLLAGG